MAGEKSQYYNAIFVGWLDGGWVGLEREVLAEVEVFFGEDCQENIDE